MAQVKDRYVSAKAQVTMKLTARLEEPRDKPPLQDNEIKRLIQQLFKEVILLTGGWKDNDPVWQTNTIQSWFFS